MEFFRCLFQVVFPEGNLVLPYVVPGICRHRQRESRNDEQYSNGPAQNIALLTPQNERYNGGKGQEKAKRRIVHPVLEYDVADGYEARFDRECDKEPDDAEREQAKCGVSLPAGHEGRRAG